MPTIGWIDALRTYNAGMPSWCVPRKGTPGYDRVMKIRQGEVVKTPKELMAELETKTGGKPKKVVRKARISLEEPAKAEEVQSVTIPTTTAKTDRPSTKSSVDTHKTMEVISAKKVAEGGSEKSMKALLYSRDKADGHILIWRRKDADTITQVADVYPYKTVHHPGGFIKTVPRERKLVEENGVEYYLTPEQKNRVLIRPLDVLPSPHDMFDRLPARIQPAVVEGLKTLGYIDDVVFKDTPTKEELEQDEGFIEKEVNERKMIPKPKREDTPEVVKLLAELDEVKKKDDNSVKSFERIHELEKEVSKLRLRQTKARKAEEMKTEEGKKLVAVKKERDALSSESRMRGMKPKLRAENPERDTEIYAKIEELDLEIIKLTNALRKKGFDA